MRARVVGTEYHDDHSAPSILVEPDQRLTVFWSGHNGHRMWYRTTRYPGDIFSWGPLRHIVADIPGRNGFTYPNPVTLPSEHGRLYLFWRGGNYSQDYETRTAGGQWGAAHEMIAQPHERPYVKYDTNGRDTIAMAFTNGHPRETLTSVYFAEYRDGWLRGASGRRIRRLGSGPIAPSRGDLVYNGATTGVSAWVWDVAIARRRPTGDLVRDLSDEAEPRVLVCGVDRARLDLALPHVRAARRSARRRSSASTRAGWRSTTRTRRSCTSRGRSPRVVRSSGGRRRTAGISWRHSVVTCPAAGDARTCGR